MNCFNRLSNIYIGNSHVMPNEMRIDRFLAEFDNFYKHYITAMSETSRVTFQQEIFL